MARPMPEQAPKTGCRCQPLNLIPPGYHNRSRSQETDATDYLSGHTSHITGSIGNEPEYVFPRHHNQGCPKAYQNMGLKSGAPLLHTAEKTNYAAADRCQKQTEQNNRYTKCVEIFIYRL